MKKQLIYSLLALTAVCLGACNNGEGSAMRVSAAGFFAETLDEARQLARASAEVTHNHPEGIKGAESVATGIYLALSGVGKTAIAASLAEYWNLNFSLNEIRSDYEFDETCQGLSLIHI